MPRETLRIATRRSNLALWQAEHIKAELEHHHPGLTVELVGIKTRGDKNPRRPPWPRSAAKPCS